MIAQSKTADLQFCEKIASRKSIPEEAFKQVIQASTGPKYPPPPKMKIQCCPAGYASA